MFNQVAPIWSVSETQAFATPRQQVIGASINDKTGSTYAHVIESVNQQAMDNLNAVVSFQSPAIKPQSKPAITEMTTALALLKEHGVAIVSDDFVKANEAVTLLKDKTDLPPNELNKTAQMLVSSKVESPLPKSQASSLKREDDLVITKEPALNRDEKKDFYLDFNALNTLKYEKDSDKALMQVAEKFEALFVQEMFKRMRSATEALGNKDNPLSNNSNSMFQTMLDTQLATSMTKQTSFGLAEMLYQQLSNNHVPNNSQGAV